MFKIMAGGRLGRPRKNFQMTEDCMCLAYSRDNLTKDKNIGKVSMYMVAEFYLEARRRIDRMRSRSS